MQKKLEEEGGCPNIDKNSGCWKIDIKFETDKFSIFMLKILIWSVTWTNHNERFDEEMVKDSSKTLEESKLTSDDAPEEQENAELTVYPIPETTLNWRIKGQHLSYTEKLHKMKLHKCQSWTKSKILTNFNLSQSLFRQIQKAFVPGILSKLSNWRWLPSKLFDSKLLV